jgi:hypothetical protein
MVCQVSNPSSKKQQEQKWTQKSREQHPAKQLMVTNRVHLAPASMLLPRTNDSNNQHGNKGRPLPACKVLYTLPPSPSPHSVACKGNTEQETAQPRSPAAQSSQPPPKCCVAPAKGLLSISVAHVIGSHKTLSDVSSCSKT